MSERNVYIVPEDRVLLRTEDVYQTEAEDDIESYSDTLLSIVANFTNSGCPDGFNAQSMVGKSKRGEVACRLFAVIDPETQTIEDIGFKTRGCLAMTGTASAICSMVKGKNIAEVTDISTEEVRNAVDGVPSGKVNTLHFAPCAVKALVGDYLIRQGATLEELNENLGCDSTSTSCIMAEHCSLRTSRIELQVQEERKQELILENNALADTFKLIRTRTKNGQLTSAKDWIDAGLVPAHMSKKNFAARVDAIVTSNEKTNDPAHASAPLDAESSASTNMEHTGSDHATEAKPHSKFANRGVGIPRGKKIAKMPDTIRAIPVEETAPEKTDAAEETFDDLKLPEGCTLEEIDGEWVLVKHETSGEPEQEQRTPDAVGIKHLSGKDGQYYFDGTAMTDNFAHWAYLAAEGDPVFTFVDCVREESRVYPRPMPLSSFTNSPLCMDEQSVMDAFEQAQANPDYSDIKTTSASNGDVYFYSTTYLQDVLADSLAEYDAVERIRNV